MPTRGVGVFFCPTTTPTVRCLNGCACAWPTTATIGQSVSFSETLARLSSWRGGGVQKGAERSDGGAFLSRMRPLGGSQRRCFPITRRAIWCRSREKRVEALHLGVDLSERPKSFANHLVYHRWLCNAAIASLHASLPLLSLRTVRVASPDG